VDDDHLVRDGLKNSVNWSALGYDSLFFAQNGKDALEKYEKHKPDLIITDIRMPIMDGIELCEKVRQISNKTKIIIISGYSEFEYAQKAILYDVFSYLLKPLETDVIHETLSKARRALDIQVEQKKRRLVENVSEYINVLLSSLLDYTNDLLQIKGKLRKTGFPIDDMYYRIVALDYQSKSDIAANLTQVNSAVKKISEENGAYYLVKDLKYYILIADKIEITDNAIGKLYKKISGELDFLSVTAGTGPQFESIEELKKQAAVSDKILKIKYYSGRGKLYFESMGPGVNKETVKNEFDIGRLIKNIKNNEKSDAVMQLNKLFTYYKSIKESEINKLCIELLQLYNKISQELIKEYPFLNVISAETVFESIYKCDSFNEVRNLFADYIEGFQDTIEDFKEFNNQHKLADNIKKYIQQNYSQNLSLDELSKIFFISSSYISKLFKKECGLNIKDYIRNIRMDKAGDMLVNSNMRIKDIAQELGYLGYRHFCTVFKNYYNITPLQYRIMNNSALDEKE
jgi:two-component system response regulator YesN